ncbi:MAG: HEPN domain-containing protein [Duncaniella sp.]|uniref:HEPN domain-containing protein n=1 Tax=Duncaniella sp. TaxID=2518496 RepID=UPI0023D49824|nr:HEPN domain-containing protein [Duncaniella sp.]MDE6090803.1 HEPN domain-containing protein [Duncaniella sp.]
MDDKTKYWIDMAEYDFETAKAMLETKRYLYVGFMCHQVIEKMLKAYWSKVTTDPPLKIHALSRLAEKTGIDKDMSEGQLDLIDALEPLNIEARYPSYKERLMKSLNADRCKKLIEQTNELRIWIRSRL